MSMEREKKQQRCVENKMIFEADFDVCVFVLTEIRIQGVSALENKSFNFFDITIHHAHECTLYVCVCAWCIKSPHF